MLRVFPELCPAALLIGARGRQRQGAPATCSPPGWTQCHLGVASGAAGPWGPNYGCAEPLGHPWCCDPAWGHTDPTQHRVVQALLIFLPASFSRRDLSENFIQAIPRKAFRGATDLKNL